MTAQQLSREELEAIELEVRRRFGGSITHIGLPRETYRRLIAAALKGIEAGELVRDVMGRCGSEPPDWHRGWTDACELILSELPKAPTAGEREEKCEPCGATPYEDCPRDPCEYQLAAPTASEGVGRKSPQTEETQQVQRENTPKGNHPSEDPSPDLDVDGLVKRLERLDMPQGPWPVSNEGVPLAREAATALQTLRDEKEFLSAANKYQSFLVERLEAERDSLRKDVERLEGALKELLPTAQLLYQNAEGCAANHHPGDFKLQGLPGWLSDCGKAIGESRTALKGSG